MFQLSYGQRCSLSSLRVLRACEVLGVLWGLILCVAGTLSLYNAVSLKKHGFEIRGLKLANTTADLVGTANGPLDGATLSWYREERWGPISDNVRVDFATDGLSRQVVIYLPYRDSSRKPENIEDAAAVLADALLTLGPSSHDNQALRKYSKAIILGGLAREASHSTGPVPQLEAHELGLRGAILEVDYPYISTSASQVMRQFIGSLLVTSLGFALVLTAAWIIRAKGRHWSRLVALVAVSAFVLMAVFAYDFLVKQRDPVLDRIRVGMIVLNGIVPLAISIGYALLARRCYCQPVTEARHEPLG